jgi:hypothetical protein
MNMGMTPKKRLMDVFLIKLIIGRKVVGKW